MPFLNRLRRWARERPDDTAVVVGGRGLSWSELENQAAARVAAPRTTVLDGTNTLDFIVSFAAAVAGGRQCAVLDPAWPEQLREEIAARLGSPEQEAGTELIDGAATESFLVGLTAGTTSVPKAFRRSRKSWQRSFHASIEFFNLTQDDRTLAPGPFAASLNLYALAECLFAGAPFHALEESEVGAGHASIAHDGITRLVVIPSMLRVLSEQGMMSSVDASGIRTIICAGSKLDLRTLESARRWAPNATIFEYYGASELSFVTATRLDPGAPAAWESTAIGIPLPGVKVRILDDNGAAVPDGEAGNIFVRSSMVGDGYLWGGDTGIVQCRGAWVTVADRGFLADGRLHILGRGSETIVTAGSNVYPHEVELALNSVPGVGAALVVGVPDDMRGQRIVAGILPSCGGLTAAGLAAGLEGLLPRKKRPFQYFVLKELPLTDRGKISRQIFLQWIRECDGLVQALA